MVFDLKRTITSMAFTSISSCRNPVLRQWLPDQEIQVEKKKALFTLKAQGRSSLGGALLSKQAALH